MAALSPPAAIPPNSTHIPPSETQDIPRTPGLPPGRSYWQRLQAFVSTPLSPTFTPQNDKPAPLRAGRRGSRTNRTQTRTRPAKGLKVRIVSWNMHDSLPKGNVEELLGNVPPYIPNANGLPAELPQFEDGPEHPYHLIVVAGQECPTVSGIPMGLAGFKIKDREDRKSKSSHHSHHHLHHPPRSPSPVKSPSKSISKTSPLLASASTSHLHSHLHSQTPTSGWSYILEDWFCRGIGNFHGAKPIISSEEKEANGSASQASPSKSPTTNGNVNGYANGKPNGDGARSMQPIDLTWDTDQASPSTTQNVDGAVALGPYQLLSKERLMGIYLAVFVHRDAAHFVEGISKDTVATGMMRGRIGNKGAVGISLKIAGTTVLFVNAHLAAHEDHVSERLANYDRIKSELAVDPFLPPKDPRQFKEDITDRFDHTFLFGDLNFRLKISRLHADWLMAHEEYAQALKFDQLREIMDEKKSFIGFNEADINFPPTYKFDVMKTIKHSKSKKRFSFKERARSLYSEFKESDTGSDGPQSQAQGESSVAMYMQQNSSGISSMHTEEPRDRDQEDSPTRTSSRADTTDRESVASSYMRTPHWKSHPKGASPIKSFGAGLRSVLNISPAKARHMFKKKKAKVKVQSYPEPEHEQNSPSLSPNSPRPRSEKKERALPPKFSDGDAIRAPAFLEPVVIAPTPNSEASFPGVGIVDPHARAESASLKEPDAGRKLALEPLLHSHSTGELLSPARANSLPSSPQLHLNTSEMVVTRKESLTNEPEALGRSQSGKSEAPVYDSSSKKRVPSWCDRILWKTNVIQKPQHAGGRRRPSLRLWTPSLQSSLAAVRRSASLSRSEVAAIVQEESQPQTASPQAQILSPSQSQPTHNTDGGGVASLLAKLMPNNQTRMRKSKTIDVIPSVSTLENGDAKRKPPPFNRKHSDTSIEQSQSQSHTAIADSVPPPPESAPPQATDPPNVNPNLNPMNPMNSQAIRWLFGFLPSREPVVSPPPPPPEEKEPTPPPIVHHKGDVVCLEYGTLDDSAMRRLEGRSDHRPILGTFSVYV